MVKENDIVGWAIICPEIKYRETMSYNILC